MSVKLFIVDTGIKADHVEFKNINIADKFGITGGRKSADYNDYFGHGTAIASIISRHIGNNPDIEITCVRIFTTEMRLQEEQLISALEFIYKNYDPDIINLSLGLNVCERIKDLRDICEKLTDRGTVIVAAFDNSGAISYPAAFKNVIGVTTGSSCFKTNDFEHVDDSVVNVAAFGNIQRIAWVSPPYIMLSGNSFACAHASAKIAEIMSGGIRDREMILNEIKKISKVRYNTEKYIETPGIPYKIYKSVLFPFNKEMHALLRFPELIPFEISGVYDTVYSGAVGSTTGRVMSDPVSKSYKINNIKNIEWDSFDTLIIGHTDALSSILNRDEIVHNMIMTAQNYGKNVYSYDDLGYLGYKNSNNIYFPVVSEDNVPPHRFGMLYRISKPVLGIFGTSPKQGKFTLQLKLREMFLSNGYNIGQLGTEPNSLLFGFDTVFPMGYNSSVKIKDEDCVNYLNNEINRMCEAEKDIIIVGSQSGTVTYDTGNLLQYNISQYNFLIGTQPDVVILCVNPYDEPDLIKRTIKFIESSVNKCKVIALVVFPMDIRDDWRGFYGEKEKLSDEKYIQVKNRLTRTTRKPVYELGDDNDTADLYQRIINYF